MKSVGKIVLTSAVMAVAVLTSCQSSPSNQRGTLDMESYQKIADTVVEAVNASKMEIILPYLSDNFSFLEIGGFVGRTVFEEFAEKVEGAIIAHEFVDVEHDMAKGLATLIYSVAWSDGSELDDARFVFDTASGLLQSLILGPVELEINLEVTND